MAIDRSHNPIVGHFYHVISCVQLSNHCLVVKVHVTEQCDPQRLFTQKCTHKYYFPSSVEHKRRYCEKCFSVPNTYSITHTYMSNKHKHAVLNYSYMLSMTCFIMHLLLLLLLFIIDVSNV